MHQRTASLATPSTAAQAKKGPVRKARHVPSKAELVARLPRGLRPKLSREQVLELGLCHNLALDDLAHGRGTEGTLWDWVGGVLTWSKVAELLQQHTDAMAEQLALATRMVERYGRTGRVGFTGPDYQLAKAGVVVQDLLAEQVDQATANQAVAWSVAKAHQMQDECRSEAVAP